MLKVIDAAHVLVDGDLPPLDSPVYRDALIVARLIEYAGRIERGESCTTLIACSRRPSRRPCRGMLWVHKTEEDRIESHCPACGEPRYLISNWRETLWADGPLLVMPGRVDGKGRH